ncbi:MAG TPA: NEW3 domain-containing protein [Paludibacteraceae bacterium]|nr:NEW3 domain-containing protein [Paludibacteraceae bacterium]
MLVYTPYTQVFVSPGESVDYTIDIINNGESIFNQEININGIPRNWNYILRLDGYKVGRIAVLPKEKKSLSLKVEVPFQVNKGTYAFRVAAGDSASLTLRITVTEKGSSETEFTTDQANMQGNATSNFSFRTTLKNRTAEKQHYALIADAPRGWTVTFNADYKQVTSVEMEPNTTKDITIDIKPNAKVKSGTYKIPVRAVTGSTSADLELEVVITGNYAIELTTPTGLVSTNITAGKEKKVTLVVKNTGSADLSGIEMKATTPSKWEVTFEPSKIDKLLPGEQATVNATLHADKKAIPGDYIVNINASTPEATADISFRVMVKTSMVWGWIGIIIILAALGGVFYLFRKFGRR